MDTYRPIDCHSFARFERAIIGRMRLRLRWQDEHGVEHLEIVEPVDLETCRGEEFLHAKNQRGTRFRLRLDKISMLEAIPGRAGSAAGRPPPDGC